MRRGDRLVAIDPESIIANCNGDCQGCQAQIPHHQRIMIAMGTLNPTDRKGLMEGTLQLTSSILRRPFLILVLKMYDKGVLGLLQMRFPAGLPQKMLDDIVQSTILRCNVKREVANVLLDLAKDYNLV